MPAKIVCAGMSHQRRRKERFYRDDRDFDRVFFCGAAVVAESEEKVWGKRGAILRAIHSFLLRLLLMR